MWDPRRLEVLRAVAGHRSFTLAAQELFTTQPAVSRQIAALERELGVELVVRGPRRVALTAAGTDLLATSRSLLADLDAVERRMRTLTDADGGIVRVGAVPSAMAALVPVAVVELRRQRPRIEVTVDEGWSADLVLRLRAGELDAIVVAELGSDATALLDEPYDVLLARDHPLAPRTRLRLADLAAEPFLLAPGAGQEVVREACAEAGFAPRVVGTVAWDATGPLVAAGLGVALTPRSVARRMAESADVEARTLVGAPRRSLRLSTSGLTPDLDDSVVASFRHAARRADRSSR